MSERATVLYDEDCGLCRWVTAKLLAWDGRRGRLRAVALQDPEADPLLRDVDPERRPSSWHLVMPDGRTRSGGRAVAPVLRLLPGGAPLAVVAEAFPRTTDRLYAWVSSHRTRIGEVLGQARCAVDPSRTRPENASEGARSRPLRRRNSRRVSRRPGP